MIKNFTPRLYQQTIFASCIAKNCLVVLPTGMGKTNIFLMLAAQRLREHPESKILFVGPTRPLIDQYRKVFEEYFEFPKEKYATFTGMIAPEKRKAQWNSATIIFSTPQGMENDILNGMISLKEVSLLGFDEAHRATGEYSYVWIAKQYMKVARYPRILALTASPGSDLEKISEVCNNLFIEDIEVRTDEDADVKPYVKEISITYEKVQLPPELKEIQEVLKKCFLSKLNEIKKQGYLPSSNIDSYSKKDLLALQASLMGELSRGNKDFNMMKSVSLAAEALKVMHAIELIETQGIIQLQTYLRGIQESAVTSKTKAVQNLVKDVYFRTAMLKTESLTKKEFVHPKLTRLVELIKQEISSPTKKLIIFTQYRDSGSEIVSTLNTLENVKAELFVGQAKKNGTGITQKKQMEMLEQFKKGVFNVIVMTSVGEEGLDIPKVDTVIFYEPIPSAIRYIQRKGRTGRQEEGKVLILMTEGTRDVGYRWSAHHKEQRMLRTLETLKERYAKSFYSSKQPSLDKYFPDGGKVKVYVDHREKNSSVVKQLFENGFEVHVEKLESADFILSARCGVEFKTVPDFVNSLIDGRIFDQLHQLKKQFERPLLIVEGTEDPYSVRNVHPNAIRGLLSTVVVGHGIPVLYTKTPLETAAMLETIAKREQQEISSNFSPHFEKSSVSLKKQQEYIVSSLPNIGPTLAKELLKKFKTVKNIVNTSEEDLKSVDKIGDKKAASMREVLDGEYKE